MKTLTQILAAAVVVGAAGVAHADFSITGASDNAGSTPTSPIFVGSTIPTAISSSSVFDFSIAGTPAFGNSVLSIGNVGLYETDSLGNPTGDASSLLTLTSTSVTGPGAVMLSDTASSWQGHVTAAGNYQVTVNWTLTGVFNGYPNWLSEFEIQNSVALASGVTFTGSGVEAYISAVPEPSQAIAGITLLGCGGLVFLGRRFVMKKA